MIFPGKSCKLVCVAIADYAISIVPKAQNDMSLYQVLRLFTCGYRFDTFAGIRFTNLHQTKANLQ